VKKFCPQCGTKLPEAARFCPECGASISGGAGPGGGGAHHAAPAAPAPMGVMTVLGIVGLVAVVFWVFLQIGRSHQTPETPSTPLAAPAANRMPPPADPRVYEIASKFYCKCGTCDGLDRVSECGCDHPRGATEILSFIGSELAAGKSETSVIQAVTTRYGGFGG
jgi:hypothetical protein